MTTIDDFAMCQIREYQPADRQGIIDVVRRVHDEYGFTWEAGGYHHDLHDVPGVYLEPGGMFWAMRSGGEVIGCVGVSIHGRTSELHRMYLDLSRRGQGLGRRLLQTAFDHAALRGCTAMQAWSDVKLTHAHRLYLKTGFVQNGERICDDPDNSREYGFWKEPL